MAIQIEPLTKGSDSVAYATNAGYATSAGTANSIAWSKISGKPSEIVTGLGSLGNSFPVYDFQTNTLLTMSGSEYYKTAYVDISSWNYDPSCILVGLSGYSLSANKPGVFATDIYMGGTTIRFTVYSIPNAVKSGTYSYSNFSFYMNPLYYRKA